MYSNKFVIQKYKNRNQVTLLSSSMINENNTQAPKYPTVMKLTINYYEEEKTF